MRVTTKTITLKLCSYNLFQKEEWYHKMEWIRTLSYWSIDLYIRCDLGFSSLARSRRSEKCVVRLERGVIVLPWITIIQFHRIWTSTYSSYISAGALQHPKYIILGVTVTSLKKRKLPKRTVPGRHQRPWNRGHYYYDAVLLLTLTLTLLLGPPDKERRSPSLNCRYDELQRSSGYGGSIP